MGLQPSRRAAARCSGSAASSAAPHRRRRPGSSPGCHGRAFQAAGTGRRRRPECSSEAPRIEGGHASPGGPGRGGLASPRLQRDRASGRGSHRALGRATARVRTPSGNARNRSRICFLRAKAVRHIDHHLGNRAASRCARRSARANAEEPAALALPATRHLHKPGSTSKGSCQGVCNNPLHSVVPQASAPQRLHAAGQCPSLPIGRSWGMLGPQAGRTSCTAGWRGSRVGGAEGRPARRRRAPPPAVKSPRRRHGAGPPCGALRCRSCTACCKATISESAIALGPRASLSTAPHRPCRTSKGSRRSALA